MTLVMFDSVDLPQLSWAVAAHRPAALSGYVGGSWPTFAQLKRVFAGTGITLMSIAIAADEDAEALDIERGDATPEQAPGWVRRQIARGVHRPCLYISASGMDALVAVLEQAGISRAFVRLWSAHYAGAHICGPSSCRQTRQACDGTQFTDTAYGRNLDQSLLLDTFFTGAKPAPAPAPKPGPQPVPAPPPEEEDDVPQLNPGVNAQTEIAFAPGSRKSVTFLNDCTAVGQPAPVLRVAVHGKGHGWDQIVQTLSLAPSAPTTVTFTQPDADGLSISRYAAGADVVVGYSLA